MGSGLLSNRLLCTCLSPLVDAREPRKVEEREARGAALSHKREADAGQPK